MRSAITNFHAHVRRQLGYLSRSCEQYDLGHFDEAIRIATVTRVLIHQTPKSDSLLTHLNANAISLLSTTRGAPSSEVIRWSGMGIARFNMEEGGAYIPKLGNGAHASFVSTSEWWSQVVMVVESHRLTRRMIVLAAANKDGGAHVDDSLPEEYDALLQAGAIGAFSQANSGSTRVNLILDAHLVSLRQIGFELLHSPELLALARD